MNKKQELVYWWLPLFALCVIAYCIQINIYLYKDVTILSHLAALMLQGQTYTHDIFEPNPPMIFYLHIPAIILSKISGIKIIYCFRLYLIMLIVLCIAYSHSLFRKLFKQNTTLIYLMSYTLACILLFQPVSAFGQREHFLIILTTPYLLLAACRLENIIIKKPFAFLIGVMAGIGFSIKPFFLPTFLFIELLFVYRQKSIVGWLRIESISASLIILFYGLSVILFFPAYWQIVLPIWMPYYRGIIKPWGLVLTSTYFLFCATALALHFFSKHKEPHSTLKIIFSLALIGYLITYLIPRVAWFYHILPALSITCLYFVLILGELADKVPRPLSKLDAVREETDRRTEVYTLVHEDSSTVSTKQFSTAIAFRKRSTEASERLKEWIFIGLLSVVALYLPISNTITSTYEFITEFHSDTSMSQLSAFMNQHEPNNSFDFFSMTHQLFTLEFYSTATYVGSIPYFFWEFSKLSPGHYSRQYQHETLSYVLNIVSHDLNDKKPEFLIVDIPSSMYYLNQRIDFPKEYAINKPFRDAWSHYTYSTTIGPYEIYQRKHV